MTTELLRPSSTGPFQQGSVQDVVLCPAPLPPEWIRSGNPVARSAGLTKASDGRLSSAVWDCQAGSFTFIFPTDEIVHILEGDVVVEAAGQRRHLRPGDVAFFAQDLESVWTVQRYVKKFAIFRNVRRPLHQRLARVWRRVLGKTSASAPIPGV